jgi:hypothetical protein
MDPISIRLEPSTDEIALKIVDHDGTERALVFSRFEWSRMLAKPGDFVEAACSENNSSTL